MEFDYCCMLSVLVNLPGRDCITTTRAGYYPPLMNQKGVRAMRMIDQASSNNISVHATIIGRAHVMSLPDTEMHNRTTDALVESSCSFAVCWRLMSTWSVSATNSRSEQLHARCLWVYLDAAVMSISQKRAIDDLRLVSDP